MNSEDFIVLKLAEVDIMSELLMMIILKPLLVGQQKTLFINNCFVFSSTIEVTPLQS